MNGKVGGKEEMSDDYRMMQSNSQTSQYTIFIVVFFPFEDKKQFNKYVCGCFSEILVCLHLRVFVRFE